MNNSKTRFRDPWTVALCWITVMLEGFDMVVLGAIIPTLIQTKHLDFTDGDATVVATLSLVGVAVGAVAVGPMADRLGRRRLLIGSVLLFSVFTIAVPFATSVAMFGILRFIAGMGLGACMPMSLLMISESLPDGMRARASTLTMTGYHVGAVIVSLMALTFTGDWQLLFYVVGIAGLIVAAIQWFKLPESQAFLAARNAAPTEQTEKGGYRALLQPKYLRACVGIWVASFMGLLLVYGLNTWLPRLMQQAGYPVPQAVAQLLILNVGGVVGLVLGGWIADKRGMRVTTFAWFLISVLALAGLSIKFSHSLALNLVVFVTGVFVFSAQVLVYAYITHAFPASVRGTALGSASGIGRLGSIVGPTITGALLTAGFGHPWGFYFFAGVALLGAIAVATLPKSVADLRDVVPEAATPAEHGQSVG